jgi:hypothetical protein
MVSGTESQAIFGCNHLRRPSLRTEGIASWKEIGEKRPASWRKALKKGRSFQRQWFLFQAIFDQSTLQVLMLN